MSPIVKQMVINTLKEMTLEQLLEVKKEYDVMETPNLNEPGKRLVKDIKKEIENQLESRGN